MYGAAPMVVLFARGPTIASALRSPSPLYAQRHNHRSPLPSIGYVEFAALPLDRYFRHTNPRQNAVEIPHIVEFVV